MRTLVLIVMIAYLVSPIDLLPANPIDDIIFLIAGQIARKRLAVREGQ